MPKLKRLQIHKLPRVRPGTELVFNEGANILLGLNGSGKTTLLKLISKVCSGVFTSFENTDFHISYEIEHAGVLYSVDMSYEAPEPGQAVSIRGSVDEPVRSVQASNLMAVLVVQRPGDEPIRIEVKDRHAHVSYRDRQSDLGDLPSIFKFPFISTVIPQIFNAAKTPVVGIENLFAVDSRPVERLDESTMWLENSLATGRLHVYELKGEVRRGEDVATPLSVIDAVVSRLGGVGDKDSLLLTHGELDFLGQTVAALGSVEATMRLDLIQRRRSSERVGHSEGWRHSYGRYEFRFIKRDGSRLEPRDLSFGQQRLFAFLYYVAAHPHILIADELTNGMHHSMIEQCVDVVAERQAFLATQNPLLLDNLKGFEDAEDVRKTFILCAVTEDDDGQEWMTWRNMTMDEAENFYRDYKVGISHVNDILRRWGLW